MAFVKKTWIDRVVQYANRRLLTKSGGEVEQVTVTRDEGTVSVVGDKFDAATMNDLETRIDNAIDYEADRITALEPQTYRVIGKMLDSRGGTIEGAGTAIVTLSNGIARIDFALDIETADTASHNYWGINRDLLTSFVGKTITPSFGGVFTYYKPDGTINADRMGYGGAFTLAEEYWKPARIYRITANPSTYGTGSWADNLFPVGSRMVGTCWGTYT